MISILITTNLEHYSERSLAVYKQLGNVKWPGDPYASQSEIVVIGLEPWPKAQFAVWPRLQVIVCPTTGLDHIDMHECKQRGITILSLQGERSFLDTVPATAEHTIGLMLALYRHLPWAFQSVVHDKWDRTSFVGRELWGKNLLVVGYGRVGKQVANLASAFGMRVDSAELHRGNRSFKELLGLADIVSLHVPGSAITEHLMNTPQFEAMKPESVLINTSRGSVVHEDALVIALKSERLSGAALDVTWLEQYPYVSPAVEYAKTHDNLLITPHIGGATRESMERTELFMAEKLKVWLQSQPL